MSDPRVMAQLRIISSKIDALATDKDRALDEIHEELELREQGEARHAELLSDHERRLRRLERKAEGR